MPDRREAQTINQYCKIGTSGKGMPCLVNIYVLAGAFEPCEVCAPSIPKMRDMMGWKPFREKFFMSDKIADFQRASILKQIAQKTR